MYRILIVEDDRGIAGAVQTQLEAWGLEARCVSDFRNVLGEFAQYQPHLVLMDIGLPFFNGFHWCSQIRASTGAARSAPSPRCPLSFSPPPRTT